MSSDVLRTVLLMLFDRGWFVVEEDLSSSSSLIVEKYSLRGQLNRSEYDWREDRLIVHVLLCKEN